VRFATANDGVDLAYARIGRGPPVVRAAYWLTHIEQDWQNLVWGPWLTEFARHACLYRYDQRGCGLSSRDVADISFDAWLRDLETVVDAAGLARFTLLGMSQGAAISIAYAIRHPQRVARLVIYGGFAKGRRRRGNAEDVEEADLQERAILLGWGRDNPAFRHIFTSQFMANATVEELAAWDDMQRHSCSAETAARIVKLTHDLDVSDLLSRVKVPTLVMHSTHDARIPFAAGRAIAAGIEGAEFVPLESAGHNLLPREAAFAQFFAEIDRFTDASGRPAGIGGHAGRPAVQARSADGSSSGRHGEFAGPSVALARAGPGSPSERPFGLTPRETEVLHELARGRGNDEIAQTMGVSSKTVRNMVSVLFDKLGVRTRSEAIVKARDAGFGLS